MAFKVKINSAGVKALLRSPEVEADLRKRAERIASAAGGAAGDYAVDSAIGSQRARASVRTNSIEAMVREARHRRLTSSLDAGR